MNITTCLFTVLGGMATLGHPSETVRLNQLGYYPQQEKVAVVNAGEVREFTIVDAATGNRLLSGKPGYTASSAWSDKSSRPRFWSRWPWSSPPSLFFLIRH